MDKPKGFEDALGEYGPQLYDGWSGKPTMWGFKILKRLGTEKWSELCKFGDMECSYPDWFLIVKKITLKEAITEYGEITETDIGPRGGFHSITLGKTKFMTKLLDPEKQG